VAATRLKNDIDTARALAFATGVVTHAQLPLSCCSLKLPQQLPISRANWSMSWTDTHERHERTGLVRCVVQSALVFAEQWLLGEQHAGSV
jgi:hypothetical protein